MTKESVFLTIMFDEEADKERVREIAERFNGVYMLKFSTGLYFSGKKTEAEGLLFELGKLNYPMQVLR